MAFCWCCNTVGLLTFGRGHCTQSRFGINLEVIVKGLVKGLKEASCWHWNVSSMEELCWKMLRALRHGALTYPLRVFPQHDFTNQPRCANTQPILQHTRLPPQTKRLTRKWLLTRLVATSFPWRKTLQCFNILKGPSRLYSYTCIWYTYIYILT